MNTKHFFGLTAEYILGGFKYVLAVAMIISGPLNAFGPLTPLDGALGFIYNSRVTLIFLGIIFTLSGLALLIGKIIKSKKWVGRGLMAIYLCFLFAAILNALAFQDMSTWIGNAVLAIITGLLWLRWKFQTQYINPRHFTRDIERLSRSS
jgi:hypothetical protein